MTDKAVYELTEVLQTCSFDEMCERYLLDADFIVRCVESGITEVEVTQLQVPQPQWRFSIAAVQRIEKARRLQRDLDINLNDLALVLDLLEEVEDLRTTVSVLRKRLQHWEQGL